MLTTELVARLVMSSAPDLAVEVWSSWAVEASALRGEDHEVAAMVRPLLSHGLIDSEELETLGATDQQLALATEAGGVTDDRQVARVVLRRHAQPGSVGGLSEDGFLAAQRLAALRAFDEVRCGPSARTSRTAQAWAAAPTLDVRWALPPNEAERAVGVHASFGAWKSSLDDVARGYGQTLADVVREMSTAGRTVLIITHDGVPQALLAALGASFTPSWRERALGYLEGVSIECDEDGDVPVVERLGAPPIGLLG